MKNVKRILFVLILVAAVLGLLYREGYLRRYFPQLERYFHMDRYFRDHDGDGRELKLFGNVEIRQVLPGFRVSGRLAELRFEEGQRVASGDLLAVLDPVPYEIRRDQQRALLSQARANLRKMSRGYRPEEIRQAIAQSDQVRASLDLAETDYRRMANLYAQGAIPRQDLDNAASLRDRLRAQLTSAESALSMTREGYRTEDVEAAAAAVDLAEAQLREAETSLADTKLHAPSDGTILTRVVEPGTIVTAGQPICALMLANPVQVRAFVSESRLGNVRPGMRGRVYMDSSPDPFWGTVGFISPEAEFTPKQVQTEDLRTDLVYRIRLRVEENPGDRLKNGMPVTVILERDSEPGR
ncbi:MAG: HlyD family efflux transporter periplasmic adaptor subunit [Synergistaceae bacterium]|nr:HlyD family efflux transporter periplasmic adaptor subunit [Synergistaceae bacterium]